VRTAVVFAEIAVWLTLLVAAVAVIVSQLTAYRREGR
jgi:hypothetical protein